MNKKLLILSALCIVFFNAHATIITVPGTWPTIQTAIDASVNGDTIVVSPGTYFENFNFRGKNVLLTSMYYLSNDTTYISSTIINGSTPVYADTASCVIFNSGEDSTAVLQGFTITGGTGTKWTDIHGAGVYREGGGILIELSSPTVRHNVILNNFASNNTGVISAGGGGIRIGDGNPEISNNVISHNVARYGPGIVLNYTGCKIRNNIITSNTGGQQFYGGSGIWILGNLNTIPVIVENNTIVNNYSVVSGGGAVAVWSAPYVTLKNNIVWGNLPLQIKAVSSVPAVTYCNVQGGYSGAGNLNVDPLFDNQSYFLSNASPCIDAGDSSVVYNDIEDTLNPGYALFPSKGLLRNDMGAYGGQRATVFPVFNTATSLHEINADHIFSVSPNPSKGIISISLKMNVTDVITVSDLNGRIISTTTSTAASDHVKLDLGNVSKGLYIVNVAGKDGSSGKKILIE